MVGQTISHYRIVAKIGEGGMGVVYKAQDLKLDRTVALKFLAPHLVQDPEGHQRFVREAKAAAALNHPNICTIHEIDQANGQSFIAMEWVEGESVRDRVQLRPLKLQDALDIAMQAADGLQVAHEKGFVHRDIKSANIMVTPRGQVKLMDFGLAQLAGRSRLTKSGTTLGTPAYMSPEQALGEAVDLRSDLWSLGVVLYEMLTGQLPFRGEHEQVVAYSILNEEPEPLTALRTGVPMELERMVTKCLAKRPPERYQRIDELQVDLRWMHQNLGSGTAKPPSSMEKRKTVPSIAVLPFVNMNRDEESEFFSDGITIDIISALGKLEGLRVAARNSVFQFKGKTPHPREVGRELKVDTVLTGSVRGAGKRLRVTVELSNVADGYEMWSERFDRTMEDIFDIQDDISQAVVGTLKVRLVGEEKKRLAKRYTENVAAYNLYLKGRFHWNQRTQGSIKTAKRYFEQALEQDPNYALAYSGLADCSVGHALYGMAPPRRILPEAKAAALKAQEIDPGLAEAHASLAFVEVFYERDWEKADRELRRAIELDPTYASAPFWRAIFVLPGLARLEEAVAAGKRAQEVDPITAVINIGLGSALFFARKHGRAIEELQRTLELDPSYHWTLLWLGRAYLQAGDYEKAFAALDRAGPMFREGHLGYGYAVSGRHDRAQQLLDGLMKPSRPDYVVAYQIALIYCGLGDKDRAFEWLEKAHQVHSAQLVWLAAPEFDPLRSDPRWADLLKRAGFPHHIQQQE